jgi:cellulose synthase/poly-beta-1,6-N-acetylglucosamine synthase-like glycosyltransferase
LELAFDRCDGEYVVVVDDDNYLAGDWIYHVESAVNDTSFRGILGTASRLPENLYVSLDKRVAANLRSFAVGVQEPDPFAPVQIAWGAGMVFKREIWIRLRKNGFRFIFNGRIRGNLIAGEDGEFCCAAAFLGYSVNYTNYAVLVHDLAPHRLTHDYTIRLAKSEGLIMAVFYYYLDCCRSKAVVNIWQFFTIYMFKSIARLMLGLFRSCSFKMKIDVIELSRNWARLSAWRTFLEKRYEINGQVKRLLEN